MIDLVRRIGPTGGCSVDEPREERIDVDEEFGVPLHAHHGAIGGLDGFGDAVEVPHGHLPVFWACGVTPQAAIMESRPPLAITHAPGHMLITDLPDRMFQVP